MSDINIEFDWYVFPLIAVMFGWPGLLIGGIAGYAIGLALARALGIGIFGFAPAIRLILFPVVLVLAAVVALLGSLVPLGHASRVEPALVLRGE